MTVPFMDAYVQLLIKTCHKRGVHAMVCLPSPFLKYSILTAARIGWYGRSNPHQEQPLRQHRRHEQGQGGQAPRSQGRS